MKTSQFKEIVENLGYKVDSEGLFSCTAIKSSEGGTMPVAIVSNRVHNSMSTNESTYIQDSLFDAIVEYAKTPIEDRKDRKFMVWFTNLDGEKRYIFKTEDGYGTCIFERKMSSEEVNGLPDRYKPENGFTTLTEID